MRHNARGVLLAEDFLSPVSESDSVCIVAEVFRPIPAEPFDLFERGLVDSTNTPGSASPWELLPFCQGGSSGLTPAGTTPTKIAATSSPAPHTRPGAVVSSPGETTATGTTSQQSSVGVTSSPSSAGTSPGHQHPVEVPVVEGGEGPVVEGPGAAPGPASNDVVAVAGRGGCSASPVVLVLPPGGPSPRAAPKSEFAQQQVPRISPPKEVNGLSGEQNGLLQVPQRTLLPGATATGPPRVGGGMTNYGIQARPITPFQSRGWASVPTPGGPPLDFRSWAVPTPGRGPPFDFRCWVGVGSWSGSPEYIGRDDRGAGAPPPSSCG